MLNYRVFEMFIVDEYMLKNDFINISWIVDCKPKYTFKANYIKEDYLTNNDDVKISPYQNCDEGKRA
jgi:hypothetical protein